jgi:UDP-N-acetylmuramoyl-tripeptide--D-alanyl-D-alanine ligase
MQAASAAGVASVITYGFSAGVDWQLVDVETTADGSTATVERGGERYALKLGVAGRHMLLNATAALIVAELAGIDTGFALHTLARLGAQPGRGQRSSFGPVDKPLLLIDESYNANTASMGAALDVFASVAPADGRKVIVLGDMRELGETADALHASLAPAVIESGATRVHLVGQHMAALRDALPAAIVASHHLSVEQAQEVIIDDLAYGDAVMIKGSNGVGLARIVSAITQKFSSN